MVPVSFNSMPDLLGSMGCLETCFRSGLMTQLVLTGDVEV
jgi:hypothetical protein